MFKLVETKLLITHFKLTFLKKQAPEDWCLFITFGLSKVDYGKNDVLIVLE
jgi:hypothetical protein